MKFQETRLENGLQIIAELNESVYSVAAGFFVQTGARDERPSVSGVSHFLEHMAFKGNDRFRADDVNRIFDEIGANYNASTSEEVTLFYGAVLPEYLPRAFELLSALIRPALRQNDFEMEKKVILEEIGMYDDLPSFTAYEKAMAAHFAGHPLGQSILGTVESVSALRSEQMRDYHRDRYCASNIMLAVAGNTDWERIVALARQHCGGWPAGQCDRIASEVRPERSVAIVTREQSLQQHIMQLAPAPPADSPLRFAAELLAVIVGDDSGSRMYWEQVDPGHAEAAELGYNEYDGCGTWLTYLSCLPEQVELNRNNIRAIFQRVNAEGVLANELEQACSKVASRAVLRSERPMGRLASLGGNWVYRNEYRTVEDDLRAIASVSLDDIRDLLEAYPLSDTTSVGVGPLAGL